MIGGTFFNVGTGDPTGDVVAWLIVWVKTFDPQTMNVGGWWGYQDQGFWTEIASYPMGRPLTGTIKWDKANRQFIASVMAKGEPEPRAEVMMPYFDWMSDTEPPVNPWKNLCAQQHTLNCTSAKTTGQVEASFDNVIINR